MVFLMCKARMVQIQLKTFKVQRGGNLQMNPFAQGSFHAHPCTLCCLKPRPCHAAPSIHPPFPPTVRQASRGYKQINRGKKKEREREGRKLVGEAAFLSPLFFLNSIPQNWRMSFLHSPPSLPLSDPNQPDRGRQAALLRAPRPSLPPSFARSLCVRALRMLRLVFAKLAARLVPTLSSALSSFPSVLPLAPRPCWVLGFCPYSNSTRTLLIVY